VRATLRQYGNVLITQMAVATSTSRTVDAFGALFVTKAFGVGRSFAVLVVIFALVLGVMILGGHLRASRQRKSKDERL
jgi:hypothetical protein